MTPERALDVEVAIAMYNYRWEPTRADHISPPDCTHRLVDARGAMIAERYLRREDRYFIAGLPAYSSEIAAAWTVLQKFHHYWVGTIHEGRTGCFARIFQARPYMSFHEEYFAEGASIPEAICRAALAAVAVGASRP